jgi:hypothetical protein
MRWIAAVECERIHGSRTEQRGASTETWDWDLQYTHDDDAGGGALQLLAVTATPQPIAIAGGAIQCAFDNQLAFTNTIPAGSPQAGTVFRWESTRRYEAQLTHSAGGSFQGAVKATMSSTQHADGTESMICTQPNGASETKVTNCLPASVELTDTCGLTNAVTAMVAATLDGGEYRVHVEIPDVPTGRRDSVLHVIGQSGCANVPPEVERHASSDNWAVGRRILDFQGAVNATDPTTFAGQAQFDHGSITWNLKTSGSPVLDLSITPATNGLLILSWRPIPGLRLQKSNSFALPAWQDIPIAEGTNSKSLLPSDKAAFFRLMRP